MRIERVNAAQKQAVYDLLCELEQIQLDQDQFTYCFDQCLNDASYQGYVLILHDDIIVYGSLRIIQQLHHCARIAQIEELIVHHACKRQGYGHMLFAYLKETAIQERCIALELSSKKSRKKAHAFYRQEGMQCEHYKFTQKL